MTIAACYLSPEGVVLGADSTSTYGNPSGPHYFNHAQKLFEIGEQGTMGVVTWGLGGLMHVSYRALLALLADDLKATPPVSVLDVATRWAAQFWAAYNGAPALAPFFQRCQQLGAKAPFDIAGQPGPDVRTLQEEIELIQLSNGVTVGFCLGGYVRSDRVPAAFEVLFEPQLTAPPIPDPLPIGSYRFKGAPNMTQRLLYGCDDGVKMAILNSPHWTGSGQDLETLLAQHRLEHPIVPLRDAVDFIHSSISSTIKAFKFSSLSQICGGPIELAVISADRDFRWVRHKEWDSAVSEGGL